MFQVTVMLPISEFMIKLILNGGLETKNVEMWNASPSSYQWKNKRADIKFSRIRENFMLLFWNCKNEIHQDERFYEGFYICQESYCFGQRCLFSFLLYSRGPLRFGLTLSNKYTQPPLFGKLYGGRNR